MEKCRTVLHIACTQSNAGTVLRLLDVPRVDVDITDVSGALRDGA
jgi:hypothetical protein